MDPIKQIRKILIYIKHEYEAKFGPCEELYDMEKLNCMKHLYLVTQNQSNVTFIQMESNKTMIKKHKQRTNEILL